MAENQLTRDDEKLRGSIAAKVLTYGTVALAILAAIIIIAGIVLMREAAGDQNKIDKALNLLTSVFYSLLPVIATWVGTVIAFYFGKANFEAANKSVNALVKHITNSEEKLKATKVSDDGVMRPFNEISYNKDIAAKEDKNINLQKDLIDFIDTNKKGDRLPIFDDKKAIRYIIHESTMNEFVRKFISGKYLQLSDKKLSDISLDQMINYTDDVIKGKITQSLAFVSKSATLFEANQKLTSNSLCQDVFVTENGIASEEVTGWITNNKIAELAKV